MMKLQHFALAAGLLAFAGSASATYVSATTNLQGALNDITNGDFYDVTDEAAQYNPDEVWQTTGTNSSINRLIFELASYEGVASFGIYDINNTSNTLEIFGTASCGTFDSTCVANENNTVLVDDDLTTGFRTFSLSSGSPIGSVTFSSNLFGYYLTSAEGTFYSQSSENGDQDNDGVDDDHMIAFKGDDSTQMSLTGGSGGYSIFSSGEYILAWEDQTFPSSDYDYSDFVVMVESVSSVFEPGSIALFGLGIAGLAASRRRQKGLVA